MSGRRIAVAVAACTAGVAGTWLVLADTVEQATSPNVLGLAAVWSFVVSGLVVWHRQPDNRIGPILVATGLARFAYEFMWVRQPMLATAGHVLAGAHIAGAAFVLLGFPTGRLGSTFNRVLFAGVVIVVGPLQVAWLLAGGHSLSGSCRRCGPNLLEVTRNAALAQVLMGAQNGLAIVVVALTVAVLVRRWRHASPRLRFAVAPMLWTGAVAFLALLLWVADDALGTPIAGTEALLDLVLVAVPISFLVGLARVRLGHSAVADLVVRLGETPAPGELRAALARALHDPTLTVAYWLPDLRRHVDATGQPVQLPAEDQARAVTLIEREGRRIAALVHDPALSEDATLVRSVGAAAALALENERLQAELRARLEDLRASRTRVVEAAEAERRRIERNLHDGTQQRLVALAMTLGLAESRLASHLDTARPILHEARENLSSALTELRELSHGIHPAILTERGLGEAVRELARRCLVPVQLSIAVPGRLPEPVEATGYYVVSEALANVAKHAKATTVAVRVACGDGSLVIEVVDDGVGGADLAAGCGLRGLADRVEALGGRLSVTSSPGAGTVVQAEMPCG